MRQDNPLADFVTGAWAFTLGLAVLGFFFEVAFPRGRV